MEWQDNHVVVVSSLMQDVTGKQCKQLRREGTEMKIWSKAEWDTAVGVCKAVYCSRCCGEHSCALLRFDPVVTVTDDCSLINTVHDVTLLTASMCDIVRKTVKFTSVKVPQLVWIVNISDNNLKN